jgi:superfamily II DNA or RNA helicase
MIKHNQIELYKMLFRGRTDVYAVRWEKENKRGYMPAYKVDWSDYNRHKAQGGSFADYSKKEYKVFDNTAIENHLEGKETIGIYPLMEDNTSYFIAADFDDGNWQESILRLYKICEQYELSAYIERSRSGNGGHLWIFFEENISAFLSRGLMFNLLMKADIISRFEKEPSFDRIFPNQDTLSGKGLGNLIALPLQGFCIKQGNSCFLDTNTMTPALNQWEYITHIQKVPKQKIEALFLQLTGKTVSNTISSVKKSETAELEIIIRGEVYLRKAQVNQKLTNFIKEHLNFLNADYFIQQNIGRTAYKLEKYFKLVKETENEVIIPRGFASTLIQFCRSENIPIKIIDERQKCEDIKIISKITLRPYQEEALEKTENKDFGVIYSPPSSGKTFIGLELIARKKQPALILVHRKQLFDQWIDRIQDCLGIPKREIGQIGNQKKRIGKIVTVAMIQSLVREKSLEHLSNRFGLIIVDECHHVPAKSFRKVITQFNSYYLYGLTATPHRKNNDENLIYIYIGNIIYELSQQTYLKLQKQKIEINIRETGLHIPYDNKTDNYELLSNTIIFDTHRNNLIVNDLIENINRFKSILILTERKVHIEVLHQYLKDRFETITLSGDDSESSRKSKLEQIKQGHYQIIISTGQFFGEGTDINSLECLFIVYPFAFEGKLVQYIGRIQRSQQPPVIFDYRDSEIEYFDKMFKQRNRYYNKLRKIDYENEIF